MALLDMHKRIHTQKQSRLFLPSNEQRLESCEVVTQTDSSLKTHSDIKKERKKIPSYCSISDTAFMY